MRVFNFSAGPATLPEEVLCQAQSELIEWKDSGQSVMEMSHRGKHFISIFEQAEADLRSLLKVPSNYKVLFLQGGAALQFAAVAMNLLPDNSKVASYCHTGEWAKKAIAEAKVYGKVHVAASGEKDKFCRIPQWKNWQVDVKSEYLHITTNETINGTEFHWLPAKNDAIPLVADMSSDILSRPIEVERFGLIYAGAQKNFGPSGLTLVIVRDDLLDRARADVPQVMRYKVQAENDSMYNTPPTFAIYFAGLMFQWIAKQGGLTGMEKLNKAKAKALYDYLDNCDGFYHNPVHPDDRSLMNIPFTLHDPKLDEDFLKQAQSQKLIQLKGHRSVGGMRASIYNAMSMQGVEALIAFMKEFSYARS